MVQCSLFERGISLYSFMSKSSSRQHKKTRARRRLLTFAITITSLTTSKFHVNLYHWPGICVMFSFTVPRRNGYCMSTRLLNEILVEVWCRMFACSQVRIKSFNVLCAKRVFKFKQKLSQMRKSRFRMFKCRRVLLC